MGVPTGDQQPKPGAFAESIGPESAILVYSPSIGGLPPTALVPALLDESTALADTSLTAVTYRRTADEWLDAWHRTVGEFPGQCTVVGVGDGERGSAAAAPGATDNAAGTGPAEPGPAAAPYAVRTVHPDDLTGLGIAVNESLTNVASGDRDAVVTFESVTALLQYVDTQRTFRFLHVLTSRIRAVDALGVFFIDPAAHDEQTVRTIDALFDAVVERDDDGEWTVRGN